MKIIFRLALCLYPLFAHSVTVDIQQKQLANGLKIIVKGDHRSPVVVSQIWYKVGSSYEPNGNSGISHMLEHMMFKGTNTYPAGEFSRIIAEIGGLENAFTGNDYTAYFQTLEKSRLEIAFKLEADRMQQLQLSETELVKEREVVAEERRMRTDDQPRAATEEQLKAVAFSNSPYQHPVIGWANDIAHYQLSDLQTWYHQWYAPNNATVVVVGDIEAETVFALAEKYFSPLAPRTLTPIKPQIDIQQRGLRRLTVKLPATMPYLAMGYKVPSLMTGDETEIYALELLSGVLNAGNSSRLNSQLIRGLQLAQSINVDYPLTSRLADLLLIEAVPIQDKTNSQLEQAILQQIHQLQTELITDKELQRIKNQLLANHIYQQDSMFYQAMLLGIYETVGLGWQKQIEYPSKILQITPEQIRAVARKYLIEDQLTIAELLPQTISSKSGENHAH